MQNTALRDDFEHSGADLPDPGKPDLITVEEAKALDAGTMADLFKEHINPGQFHFMKLLGFHKVKIETAEGMYYVDQNGRKILDFFGGFGSLAHGHNHPQRDRGAAEVPGRRPPRDSDCLPVPIRDGSCKEPGRLFARRTGHGVPRILRLGSHGSRGQGGRTRVRQEELQDRACGQFLSRQDQGCSVDHGFGSVPGRFQARRQPHQGAVRRSGGPDAGD